MSIWVEIHCDAQLPPVSGEHRPECYAHNGRQVGGMARTASRVQRLLRKLAVEALGEGWSIAAGKWTCPRCNRVKAQPSREGK